jgi:hypothetical protein
MAAPNIVNVTTIFGRTAVLAITTTATAILSNPAASNEVLKCNLLLVSNVDGTNNASVNIDIFRSSTAFPIAFQMTVPAGATLDILSAPLYLEEGDSIRLTASANGDLVGTVSYEDIA